MNRFLILAGLLSLLQAAAQAQPTEESTSYSLEAGALIHDQQQAAAVVMAGTTISGLSFSDKCQGCTVDLLQAKVGAYLERGDITSLKISGLALRLEENVEHKKTTGLFGLYLVPVDFVIRRNLGAQWEMDLADYGYTLGVTYKMLTATYSNGGVYRVMQIADAQGENRVIFGHPNLFGLFNKFQAHIGLKFSERLEVALDGLATIFENNIDFCGEPECQLELGGFTGLEATGTLGVNYQIRPQVNIGLSASYQTVKYGDSYNQVYTNYATEAFPVVPGDYFLKHNNLEIGARVTITPKLKKK